MSRRVINVNSCEKCPFHSESYHHLLEEGKELDEYTVGTHHVCSAPSDESDNIRTWWDENDGGPSINVRDWCPLPYES